jgi:hypothetical protein
MRTEKHVRPVLHERRPLQESIACVALRHERVRRYLSAQRRHPLRQLDSEVALTLLLEKDLMKRRTARVILLTLTLCLGLGGCTADHAGSGAPKSVEASAPLLRWSLGTAHRYRIELSSAATFAPAINEGFAFDLAAVADVAPIRVQGDEVELILRLSDVQLTSKSGQHSSDPQATTKQLAEPYVFTLKGGRLQHARMASGVSAETGSLLRTLSSAFQIAQAEVGATAWQALEHDATGEYAAEYRRDGAVIHKRKSKYTRLNVPGDVTESIRRSVLPRLIESAITLTPRAGALVSVVLREHAESQLLLENKVSVHTELELNELGSHPSPPEKIASLYASTRVVEADKPLSTTVRKDRFDEAKIGGFGFDDLRAQLEVEHAERERLQAEAKVAGPGAASAASTEASNENTRARLATFTSMAALLRQQPAALTQAVALVRAGSPLGDVMIDALGSAGTPEAQRELVAVMRDATLPKRVRLAAAMGVIRVKEPVPGNVQVLRSIADDALLREFAIYGLGTASRRLRVAGQTAVATEATDALVALLATTKDEDVRMLALRGISNSGDVGALPAVKPWLTNESMGVRHAAIDALRLMQHANADAWLAERLRDDESASMQAAVIAAATGRVPSAPMADALAKASLEGKDAIVRHRAVELASSWLEAQPRLTSTLQQVADKEEQPEIRELALNALNALNAKKAR